MRKNDFSLAFIGLLSVLFTCFVASASDESYQDYEFVVIQSLNKITAKTEKLKIRINDTVELEKLNITPRTCKKTNPKEAPETIAFLEIDQLDNDFIFSKRLFSGWMFASSPSLSALEHPIIDIKLLDCETMLNDQAENLPENSENNIVENNNSAPLN